MRTQWEISRKRGTKFKLQNIKSTSSRVLSLLFLVSQATLPPRAAYDPGRSPAEEWMMMMMNKCAKVGTTRGTIPPVKHKNRLQVDTEGRERD